MSEYLLTNKIMARPITKLEHIERAAIRLFARKGVGRVTLKDIAKGAGTAEGTLYRHYPSMESFAWALFKREVERFGKKAQEILDSQRTFTQRIHDSVSLFYTFYDEDPMMFTFILLSQHQFPREKHLNRKLNPDNLVLKFIQDGVDANAFRVSDPKLAAATVMGIVLMPALFCSTGLLKGSMKSRIESTTHACLQVLNVHSQSGAAAAAGSGRQGRLPLRNRK
jgi:AcrR family transcriptional regulator